MLSEARVEAELEARVRAVKTSGRGCALSYWMTSSLASSQGQQLCTETISSFNENSSKVKWKVLL